MKTYAEINDFLNQVELNEAPSDESGVFNCSEISQEDQNALLLRAQRLHFQLQTKEDGNSLLNLTFLNDLIKAITKDEPPVFPVQAQVNLPIFPIQAQVVTPPLAYNESKIAPSIQPQANPPVYGQLYPNAFPPQAQQDPLQPNYPLLDPTYGLAPPPPTYPQQALDAPPPYPVPASSPMKTPPSESYLKLKNYFQANHYYSPWELPTNGLTDAEIQDLKNILTNNQFNKVWIEKIRSVSTSLSDKTKLLISAHIVDWLNKLKLENRINLSYIMDLLLLPVGDNQCFYILSYFSTPTCMDTILSWIEEYLQHPENTDKILSLFYKSGDAWQSAALKWCFKVENHQSQNRLQKIIRTLSERCDPRALSTMLFYPEVLKKISALDDSLQKQYKEIIGYVLLSTQFDGRKLKEINFVFKTPNDIINAIKNCPDRVIQLECCVSILSPGTLLNKYFKAEKDRAEIIALRDQIAQKPQDVTEILDVLLTKKFENMDLPDPALLSPDQRKAAIDVLQNKRDQQSFLEQFFTLKYKESMQIQFIQWLENLHRHSGMKLHFLVDYTNPRYGHRYEICLANFFISIANNGTPAVFKAAVKFIQNLMNMDSLDNMTCRYLLEGVPGKNPYSTLNNLGNPKHKEQLADLQALRKEAMLKFGFQQYTIKEIKSCFKNREEALQIIMNAPEDFKKAALTESQRVGSSLNHYFVKSIRSNKSIRDSLKVGHENTLFAAIPAPVPTPAPNPVQPANSTYEVYTPPPGLYPFPWN